MAKNLTIRVEGVMDVERNLRKLPSRVQKRAIQRALRRGAKVVLVDAKRRVPVDTGLLRNSLRLRPQRGDALETGLVLFADQKRGGFHAHLIEFGTKPHRLKGGGMHPGTSPQPFMRPAFDSKKRKSVDIIAKAIGVEIEREAKKLNRTQGSKGKPTRL